MELLTTLQHELPDLSWREIHAADSLELMQLVTDEKAELAYLLKADDDPAELRAYAASARKALDDFLSLMP